jgi:hypothetical protein
MRRRYYIKTLAWARPPTRVASAARGLNAWVPPVGWAFDTVSLVRIRHELGLDSCSLRGLNRETSHDDRVPIALLAVERPTQRDCEDPGVSWIGLGCGSGSRVRAGVAKQAELERPR